MTKLKLIASITTLVAMTFLPLAAGATVGTCGDGTLTEPEECDDGNRLDKDCCSKECTIEIDGSPCDDGLFCTRDDACLAGVCEGDKDPCSEGPECQDTCNEELDNCIAPEGTSCSDDSNPCTADKCDVEGKCSHLPGNEGAPCRFAADVCDVKERCDGTSAVCPADVVQEAGVICRAAAGDCDAAESCDGSSVSCPGDSVQPATTSCGDPSDTECDDPDTCDAAGFCQPNNAEEGTGCDDGAYCNGSDTCSGGACTHAGAPCPGGECGGCDEQLDSCTSAGASTPCTDDEDPCTRDHCDGAGTCAHPPIPLAPVCNWAVIGGSDTRTSSVRTRTDSEIDGGVCADTALISTTAALIGHADWALLAESGTAARVGAFAVIADGSFATGGGCVEGLHGSLVYDTSEESICCDDGDVELPGGNPANVINACGTNDLVGLCADAKAQIPGDVAYLDGLPGTQDLGGPLSIGPHDTTTLLVGAGLNVIDAERIKINTGGNLVIDAQGNPDAVVVVRVANGIKTRLRSTISLAGGALPENVVFYAADGDCTIGYGNLGAGTLFCPGGPVRMRVDTEWQGAVAGGISVDIGWNVLLLHKPFLGLAAYY